MVHQIFVFTKQVVRPLAFGLGVGLGLAVCLGGVQRISRFDTIEAKRFHVVDAKGKLLAEFGLGDEMSDPALVFYNREGDTVAHLLTPEKHPTLVLFGPNESAAMLRFDDSGPFLLIRDKQGKTLGQVPTKR